MAKYDFNKDIIEGEAGEDVVRKLLESYDFNFISNNKDNRYDIIMEYKGKQKKYEIKTDVYCKPGNDTGNIFVEHLSRGKDSGITVTEADWYVTYFKHFNEVWFIETEKLKILCVTNKIETRSFGGDAGSDTRGYLVPREMFRKEFNVKKIKFQ